MWISFLLCHSTHIHVQCVALADITLALVSWELSEAAIVWGRIQGVTAVFNKTFQIRRFKLPLTGLSLYSRCLLILFWKGKIFRKKKKKEYENNSFLPQQKDCCDSPDVLFSLQNIFLLFLSHYYYYVVLCFKKQKASGKHSLAPVSTATSFTK